MGAITYPDLRSGQDLRTNRQKMLEESHGGTANGTEWFWRRGLKLVRLSRRVVYRFAFFLMLCSPVAGHSQSQQTQRPTSTPYSGDLSIFETPGRDERLQIQRVMDLLGIKHGSAACDLGAGSGWFTVRAAARVGPTGTVYAEDINPEAIRYIDQRLQKEKIENVHTILGTPDDPKLPPRSIDAALLLKVYHEIAHPLVLLAN